MCIYPPISLKSRPDLKLEILQLYEMILPWFTINLLGINEYIDHVISKKEVDIFNEKWRTEESNRFRKMIMLKKITKW